MKKTLVIIGLALAGVINNVNAQSTTYTFSAPTNVPPALIAAMIQNNAMQLASRQIYMANLAQLSALSPTIASNAEVNLDKLTAAMPSGAPTNYAAMLTLQFAKKDALAYLKAQTNVDMINSNIVAVLPLPVVPGAPTH